MRIRFPAGSRTAQSRTPYGCSVDSWTTSAPLVRTRSKTVKVGGGQEDDGVAALGHHLDVVADLEAEGA
jgi:hypothetical protein